MSIRVPDTEQDRIHSKCVIQSKSWNKNLVSIQYELAMLEKIPAMLSMFLRTLGITTLLTMHVTDT